MTSSRFSPTFLLPFVLALVACGSGAEEPKPAAEPTPTNQWSGHTYLLDITAANWSQPRGVGREIDDFVPNFLMRIDGTEPDRFSLTMAAAKVDGAQDFCSPTSTLEATSENPNITIGPIEFPMHIQHAYEAVAVDAIAYGLTITNVLPNGDAPAQDGTFSAIMDFRQVYELFTVLPEPTPDATCISFEDAYGFPCEPCPTDDYPYCLTLEAVDLGATVATADIEPVAPEDIDPVACAPMEPPPAE